MRSARQERGQVEQTVRAWWYMNAYELHFLEKMESRDHSELVAAFRALGIKEAELEEIMGAFSEIVLKKFSKYLGFRRKVLPPTLE